MTLHRLIVPVAALALAGPAVAAGDAARGKQLFVRCGICHAVAPGVNRIGPSLAGVVGRPSASVAGFAYSPALTAAKLVWTPAELDTYLAKPAAKVPGTKMLFPGLANADDRANVIAYLQTPQ